MSGNSELFAAMKGFGESVSGLITQRAITNASDEVRKIKESELEDHEKFNRIKALTDDLGTRMIGVNMPETHVARVVNSLMPPVQKTSNEMMAYGLQTGNASMQERAGELQKHEKNPEYKIKELETKHGYASILAADKKKEKDNERFFKGTTALTKLYDPQLNSKSALGKLQTANNNISDVVSLINTDKPITPLMFEEAIRGLDRVVSGGNPTVSGQEHIRIKNLEMMKANLLQMIKSKPEEMNSEGTKLWKKQIKDSLLRIKSINDGIILDTKKGALKQSKALSKLNPEAFQDFSRAFLKGEAGVVYDEKGNIDFDDDIATREDIQDVIEMYNKDLKLKNSAKGSAVWEQITQDPQLPSVLKNNKGLKEMFGRIQNNTNITPGLQPAPIKLRK